MSFPIKGAHTYKKPAALLLKNLTKYHLCMLCQLLQSLIRTTWAKRHRLSIPNRCYTFMGLTIPKISPKRTDFIKSACICLFGMLINYCFETKQRSKGSKNKQANRRTRGTFGLSLTHGLGLYFHRAPKLPVMRAACLVAAH